MDASVTETYLGEWKNDRRTGFGISERSDGLRYEGEWFNNKKYGYGVTTFRDGNKEEGKYKNNVLITSQKKKHLFLIRSAKFRERIEAAVNAAQRASKIALQKADIAISRTATARGKAELADIAAEHAREDSDIAQRTARQFAPDFRQPGLERLRNREIPKYVPPPQDTVPGKSILLKNTNQEQNLAQNPNQGQGQGSPPGKQEPIASPTSPSQSLTQSITQSMRRASMKPAQNQIASQQSQLNQNNQFQPIQNQLANKNSELNQNQQQPPIGNQIGFNLGQNYISSQNPYSQSSNQYTQQQPTQNQIPSQNQLPNQFPQTYGQGVYSQGIQGQFSPQSNEAGSHQYVQNPYGQDQDQLEQYQIYQAPIGFQYPSQQGYQNQQVNIGSDNFKIRGMRSFIRSFFLRSD